MIGICTDSNSQIPAELTEQYGIVVVPITVELDGREYLEGVDLDADAFYQRFSHGHRPTVVTSQPSPGQFAVAYDELAERGCREILSIHVGSNVSGTVNSARLAARSAPVPVRLVDTGLASFGVACCVWQAAIAVEQGASIEAAATAAEAIAPLIGNVFIVAAIDLVRAGGRAAPSLVAGGAGTPVLTLHDGRVESLGLAATLDDAVESMAAAALASGLPINVAVGLADRDGSAVSEALLARLQPEPLVRDIVRYRVGPSVGAHTGPGTAGAFFFPV